MASQVLTPQDYWRAIVLYGHNVATYKIALADCLIAFARGGKMHVAMPELAAAFFHLYVARLASGQPQQSNPARKTVLERAVEAYQANQMAETTAVDRVARQGFNDVLPRFHTVNGAPVPRTFYEQTPDGLVLTDALLGLFAPAPRPDLQAEVASRWDLLEAAFAMHMPVEVLGTDEHMLYLRTGYARINITSTHPVLNGYQNGRCFYCGEPLDLDVAHVDHVIPRAFLRHDELWNLVLAHESCNLAKSARLPSVAYLERLYERNEYFIASNHPIKQYLIAQLGAIPAQRRAFLERIYGEAQRVVVHIWPGMPGGALQANPLTSLRLTRS